MHLSRALSFQGITVVLSDKTERVDYAVVKMLLYVHVCMSYM